MTQLTLTSPQDRPLRPLVEVALANELRLLEGAIRRTQQRLQEFESRYHLSTDEFLHRFERGELTETLDYDEWIGESRMLQRLQEKAETLRGIEIAD